MEKGQFESFMNLNITDEGRDVVKPPVQRRNPPKRGREANLPLRAAARGHVVPLVGDGNQKTKSGFRHETQRVCG